jgi:hypothetical protein
VGGHGSSRGDPRRRGHAEQRLTDGRAGGAGPPAALARSERAHGVEYNEAKLVRLMAAAVVAQGSPATYADGPARDIANGGALRRPR